MNPEEKLVVVIVDDAKLGETANYGGSVAGPVFAKIGEKAARHLDMDPEAACSVSKQGSSTTAVSLR